jgi:hypothetical protein
MEWCFIKKGGITVVKPNLGVSEACCGFTNIEAIVEHIFINAETMILASITIDLIESWLRSRFGFVANKPILTPHPMSLHHHRSFGFAAVILSNSFM